MRVLIIPELYRPEDASANATLNDAVTWVEQWLRIDPTLHVYWLLPHRGDAGYDGSYVLADRDRVTLIEADAFMADTEYAHLFTESGYTDDQLLGLKREIFDGLGYVDAVIDQLRQGRADLYKWLLYLSGHRTGEPTLFDLVVNVHDLMLPFKYPGDGYRIDYHRRLEVAEAVLADGRWFKARLDADGLPVYGREFMRESVIEAALDDAVMTDSPIDLSRFRQRYAAEPRWLHVAGSGWGKKHVELVMEIAASLHERYGIRTILTSMDEIPEAYLDLPWVEAHPRASWATYEDALRRGDVAVCATEYDTLARTWFEQAASGQVLILRDEPWIYDCVPEGHPLVAPVEELAARTQWAVEHWDEAVAANRRLVAHVHEVRSPERTGRRTHDDLVRRVEAKTEAYAAARERDAEVGAGGGAADPTPLSRVAEAVDGLETATVDLCELDERGAAFTDDAEPFLTHEWCSLADLVFALRVAGYADVGDAGTPTFRRSEA